MVKVKHTNTLDDENIDFANPLSETLAKQHYGFAAVDTLESLAKKESPLEEKKIKSHSFSGLFDWLNEQYTNFFTSKPKEYKPNAKSYEELQRTNKKIKELQDEYEQIELNENQAKEIQQRFEELLKTDQNKAIFYLNRLLLLLTKYQINLKEKDSVLLKQLALSEQLKIQDYGRKNVLILEKLEHTKKTAEVFKQIGVKLTGGCVIISGIALASGAAALATGGATLPITAGLYAISGILAGLKGINTLLEGVTEKQTSEVQALSIMNMAEKKEVQFELTVHVEDMGRAMKEIENLHKMLTESAKNAHAATMALRV
ncbi:MAG: hypothetical protein BGO10_05545 [Chlamydia sp. 32-24]|nr:MAG: hypothetical protein BGO10_05545 [Chlamydia sp. 32-24]